MQLVLSRSGSWDAPAIASELEVSERTVYRDLQTLTMAGVPLFFDEQAQRYCVRPGFRLTCLEGLGTEDPSSNRQPGPTATVEQLADATAAAARKLASDAEDLAAVLDRLREALRSGRGTRRSH